MVPSNAPGTGSASTEEVVADLVNLALFVKIQFDGLTRRMSQMQVDSGANESSIPAGLVFKKQKVPAPCDCTQSHALKTCDQLSSNEKMEPMVRHILVSSDLTKILTVFYLYPVYVC